MKNFARLFVVCLLVVLLLGLAGIASAESVADGGAAPTPTATQTFTPIPTSTITPAPDIVIISTVTAVPTSEPAPSNLLPEDITGEEAQAIADTLPEEETATSFPFQSIVGYFLFIGIAVILGIGGLAVYYRSKRSP